jgi:hypothetical protein
VTAMKRSRGRETALGDQELVDPSINLGKKNSTPACFRVYFLSSPRQHYPYPTGRNKLRKKKHLHILGLGEYCVVEFKIIRGTMDDVSFVLDLCSLLLTDLDRIIVNVFSLDWLLCQLVFSDLGVLFDYLFHDGLQLWLMLGLLVEVPVDYAVFAIALFEPGVGFLEVAAVELLYIREDFTG